MKPCPFCGAVGEHVVVPLPHDPARRIKCPNDAIARGAFVRVKA